MVLSEFGEEFISTGIDLYKDNVETIKKEFQKNKAFREIGTLLWMPWKILDIIHIR